MADQTEYRIVFPDSVTIDTANILRSRIVGALSQQDFGSLTICSPAKVAQPTSQCPSTTLFANSPLLSICMPWGMLAAPHSRYFWPPINGPVLNMRDSFSTNTIGDLEIDKLSIVFKRRRIASKAILRWQKTSSKAERKFLQVSWPPLAETAPQPLSRQMMRKSTTLWETSVILAKPGESPFGSPEPAPSLISPILPQLDERSFGASVTHCILSRRCRSPCIAHMGSTAPAISLNTRHRG